MKAYNEVAWKIVYRSRWPVLYTQRSLYPVTESTSARSEVLELSRHSGSTDLSTDTTEAASFSLSFSDLQRWALSSGPFSLFKPGRISVQMHRRKEDLPRRSGTGSATVAWRPSSFRDYQVDFRRSVAVVYKTHFVLEEGIIDWNRSPPPMASAPSIPSFHLYSRKDRVVDLFLKNPMTWAFSPSRWNFCYINHLCVVRVMNKKNNRCKVSFYNTLCLKPKRVFFACEWDIIEIYHIWNLKFITTF